ncbi:tetratricopeptide repeat protein [Gloeocapsa sp. PCC 73106]|uniref:tetratricopeptide repeat protein n=1 Tax=Gloeocapsa sp. PCC 73106 TaxID=102232 RepID=UPI0002AD1960|nr:tetratricopeptide repeat protein [Gloeocapsa sp. PCC 73106]ELR98577.1 tetratricopeptide repeat protein [Gloeocapsa sp. PCC 73106]
MSETKHWLDFAEIGAAVASVGGAIATIAGQSAVYATIPLSLSVSLNLLNRRRLLNAISDHHNQGLITLNHQLKEVRETQTSEWNQYQQAAKKEQDLVINNFNTHLAQLRQEFTTADQNLRETIKNLDYEKTKLAEVVGQLQQIENFSQAIRTNPNCAEFYYQRGLSHQHLGDKQGAIGDYSKAIQLEPDHPGAHHQRGILNAELGHRRQAVEDLRRAAKLYFEHGDIDSYQQARDLSKDFHRINTPLPEEAFEKIKIATFLA